MKNKMIKILFFTILFCLQTLIVSVPAQEQNLVSIDSTNKTVTTSQTFTIAISCVPSQPIKAFELKVSFDASLLQANSVTEGNIFQEYRTFFNAGIINNIDGNIRNIYNLIVGNGNVSNIGTLIIISFTTKSTPGIAILNLYDVGVTNEVEYIPITIQKGTITIQGTSQAPNTPSTPFGPTTLNINSLKYYTTSATDPNGDKIQYRFDWNATGSHQYSTWSTLMKSGQTINNTHSWSTPGNYMVKAQARDEHGSVSSWSNGVTIIVSKGTEILNQQQTQYNKNFAIYTTRWDGQSFKPTKSALISVEIYMRKIGSPSSNIVLSIRSSLSGVDLVSLSKPASQIPTSYGWVKFDFNDLTVTPGSTYYLILRTTGGSNSNCYWWGYGYQTPYTIGIRVFSTTGGSSWTNNPSYDSCFKTYGI